MRTAASVSWTDVQNAVNSATSGDTVTIPAGTATWSSAVTVSKPIIITGAGQSSTVIHNPNSASSGLETPLFDLSLNVDERLEISGMRLTADVMNRSNGINMRAGAILATQIVIHDITFDNFSFGIMNGTNGNAIGFGVIYNCTFNNNRITTRNSGFVNTAALKGASIPFPAWGTKYYMVYEDNIINFTNWSGGPQGANYLGDTEYPMNYVVRHCTINVNRASGQSIEVDGYDMHGNYGTYLNNFGFIIHDNVWNYSGGNSVGVKVADIRGGVGSLIFNNTIYGQSGNYIVLRADPAGSAYPQQTYTWNNRSNATAINNPGSVGPPAGYTEIAYPHPLRSGAGGGTQPPVAPAGLVTTVQ